MAAAEGSPFAPGSHAGPYEILRELGHGGMGRVLLARDTSTGGRLVALKVLIADTTHRPLLEARFQREIQNLARLRHPGIVTVFTAGAVEGHPYLAMDYLVGRDLNEFALECAALPGPVRISRLGRVMVDVARAVAYAHSKGVVHRDIKPSNIRITAESDAAILLDFGISKCLDDIGLTGIEMPGTALYMAPEQFDARLLVSEPLIDVWALGVNLYLALTGRLPFHGDCHAALSHAVTHLEPEPPRRIDGDISQELEEVILACLHKDPRARIASADAVARGLASALGFASGSAEIAPAPPPLLRAPEVGEPATAAPSGRGGERIPNPWRSGARRSAALLLLGLALASAAFGWLRTEGAAGVDLRQARSESLEPAITAPEAPAGAADHDERIRKLLGADQEVVRSVLLYTSEVDVPHRRRLMAALTDLRTGRYDDALPKLQAFAREHPRSPLVPLVRFWIGTSYSEVGRLEDAIREYDDIARTAPRSAFAPRAMLFAAASRVAIGDEAGARTLLRRLREEYPDTEPAREAANIFPSVEEAPDRGQTSRTNA